MSPLAHHNPDGMPKNPAFSQAVSVTGPHRTIYVGGQNAVDEHEQIVGRGDIGAQAQQVFANLRRVLDDAGASLEHIVKWNILVVEGQPVEPGFAVFQQEWGQRPNPPAITVQFISGLAHPDFLIEVDAIAVVPQ